MQRPYPRPRDRVYDKATKVEKTLMAAGEQPVAVKLDRESGGEMDDVVEMREVMVRTGNVYFSDRHDHQQPLCGSGFTGFCT